MTPPPTPPLAFATRLWFAFVCFFKILFDGIFARRTWELDKSVPQLPSPAEEQPLLPVPVDLKQSPPTGQSQQARDAAVNASIEPALQLLALFQREGRLVDFLEEDIVTYPDADVGAAARVIHQGCRRALHEHSKVLPVRAEPEGGRVAVTEAESASEVKLIGALSGSPPFHGTLRHRGWRIEELQLPSAVGAHDPRIIAPAEVEL